MQTSLTFLFDVRLQQFLLQNSYALLSLKTNFFGSYIRSSNHRFIEIIGNKSTTSKLVIPCQYLNFANNADTMCISQGFLWRQKFWYIAVIKGVDNKKGRAIADPAHFLIYCPLQHFFLTQPPVGTSASIT